MPPLLDKSFYIGDDVVGIARSLLGCIIQSRVNGITTSGIITETEAYRGPEDKASHAYNNRRTPRTNTMFEEGGTSYIYLCYGIHHLFNVVTGPRDIPHAVLIRAIRPLENIPAMLERRGFNRATNSLTNGPGKWTQAMGITTQLDNIPLYTTHSLIQIYEGISISKDEIIVSPRVGIDYAEEWIGKPWRFIVKNKV